MIPDLIYKKEIRHFIFESTGQWIPQNRINNWIKSGKIEIFRLPGERCLSTTKKIVLKFIRKNSI